MTDRAVKFHSALRTIRRRNALQRHERAASPSDHGPTSVFTHPCRLPAAHAGHLMGSALTGVALNATVLLGIAQFTHRTSPQVTIAASASSIPADIRRAAGADANYCDIGRTRDGYHYGAVVRRDPSTGLETIVVWTLDTVEPIRLATRISATVKAYYQQCGDDHPHNHPLIECWLRASSQPPVADLDHDWTEDIASSLHQFDGSFYATESSRSATDGISGDRPPCVVFHLPMGVSYHRIPVLNRHMLYLAVRDGAIVARHARNFYSSALAADRARHHPAIVINERIAAALRDVPSYPDILIGSRGVRFLDMTRLILLLGANAGTPPSDRLPADVLCYGPHYTVTGSEAEQHEQLWQKFCGRLQRWSSAHPHITLPPTYAATPATEPAPRGAHPLEALVSAHATRIAETHRAYSKLAPAWLAGEHWHALGANATTEMIERQFLLWLMTQRERWYPIPTTVLAAYHHGLIHDTVSWLPADTFVMLLERAKLDRLDALMGFTLRRALDTASIDDTDDLVNAHLVLPASRLVKTGTNGFTNKQRIASRRRTLSHLLRTHAAPILADPTANSTDAQAAALLAAIKQLTV